MSNNNEFVVPQIDRLFEIDSGLKYYRPIIEARHKKFRQTWQEIESTEPGGMDQFTRSYEVFGINVRPDGSIYCCEWCPAAEQVMLWGEFNQWNRISHKYTSRGNGIWDLNIPAKPNGQCAIAHDSIIRLIVVNKDKHHHEIRVSPWAHYVTQDEKSQLFMQRFWNPEKGYKFKHPHPEKPSSLRIYEVHVGISSEEEGVATYKHFTRKVLPRIDELGYNAIELMAIMEHAYYGSFGYQVTNFFAASSRYGTPDELKELIDMAHARGISVFLDLTHSHASRNVLDGLNEFDGTEACFFHEGLRGLHDIWEGRLFNYSEQEVLRFLLSNLRWWVEEYYFDGLRFDGVSSMLYVHHLLDGLSINYDNFFHVGHIDIDSVIYLMLANELLHTLYPSVITIAEEVTGMPGLCRPIAEGGFGFDYRMSMAIPRLWTKLVVDEPEDNWSVEEIVNVMTFRRYMEKSIAYVECHDQAIVGDQSMLHHMLGNDEIYNNMSIISPPSVTVDRGIALHKMFRLITHSLGGEAYLNFVGNEFGHPEWLDFPREDNNFSCCFARRQWSLVDNKMLKYQYLNKFDHDLNHLEIQYGWLSSYPAFVSRKHREDKTIVYERAGLVFVFNFHPSNFYKYYQIGAQQRGRYKIVLNTDDEKYGGKNYIGQETEFHTFDGDWDCRANRMIVDIPSRTGIVLHPD